MKFLPLPMGSVVVGMTILVFIYCQSPTEDKCRTEFSIREPLTHESIPDNQIYQLKLLQTKAGWGYEIYFDGKRYIVQPHLPAIGGKKGFENRKQAEVIGKFVISKLQKGIFPPTVTAAEVDSLLRLEAK